MLCLIEIFDETKKKKTSANFQTFGWALFDLVSLLVLVEAFGYFHLMNTRVVSRQHSPPESVTLPLLKTFPKIGQSS
jgi:hypothetical protein